MRNLLFLLPLILFVCTGCTNQQRLASDFKQTNVVYPPKHLALLVFKKSKKMELYARNDHSWHFIKTYSILAASGGPGPKLHEGDRQVPDGIYHIVGLNPKSHFDLSMHLNYPNAFDRSEARHDHRHNLGGDIFIHGKNRSIGCVAIGDSGIEQLFPLVAAVGVSHVQVIIAPDDLRQKAAIYGREHPSWLPGLYHRITLALASFPEPT